MNIISNSVHNYFKLGKEKILHKYHLFWGNWNNDNDNTFFVGFVLDLANCFRKGKLKNVYFYGPKNQMEEFLPKLGENR